MAADAGRGVAAEVVLGDPAEVISADDADEFSNVPVRWIVFAALQALAVGAAGASHFGGRGGRLEPEVGANVALVSAIIAVLLSVLAVRLLPVMSLPMRRATRITVLVGSILIPVGLVVGLARLVLGEADEVDVMVRAAVVQALAAAALLVLLRRMPSPVEAYRRRALTDEECARLIAMNPEKAQRMKDAEIHALLAQKALGQVDQRLADRESARLDERWGVGLVDGAS
ncbi:hypothetical protein OVN20_04385 [Microcella daejeonensis]|uniref:hypothetical protein n=1 Tax=Microcella daejeonensis TaxID=2994971 RepID=UPI002271582C|nr:hypothetical protein [Microcella daejeonensis]WAB84810.1 hypothetical protein OVN20_04385 [Microcella daejeonensis]